MSPTGLVDGHGRQITYLRLSVTDQCNFRCVYCMPPEGIAPLKKSCYMTPDEMVEFTRALAAMGVWRVRLTGGEPLLRKDIVPLAERLARVPGVRDLALTTNGEHLAPLVDDLKRAGIGRMNISLDSMDPERFHHMTKVPVFNQVMDGIDKTLSAGLKVKINVVAMNGISPEEIDAFARFAMEHPVEVRFIEFMPLCGTGWHPELVLPIEVVRSRIRQTYRLEPLPRGSEVAESYRLVGGKGKVGFIASMTEPFCSTCSRIRISATGQIQLCLFSRLTHNILPVLRSGAGQLEIQQTVRDAVLSKPASHPWADHTTGALPQDNALIRAIGG